MIVAGLVLIAGIILAVWQALRISRPLHVLSQTAREIAEGQFNQRVHVRSSDEIGQLADSFNTMAEGLKSLLIEMAGKASLERELALARSVQELMSPPPRLLSVGPFALAGSCEPASQCGGDWWTYRQLSGDRLLVVVGDVTGHGMPAAMIAATGRGAVEALAHVDDTHVTPQLVLDAVDSAIRDVGNETLLMTCFAMVLHPRAGLIQFANAGHTFPYVGHMDSNGRLADLGVLAVNGNPLGNRTKLVQAATRPLRPGTTVVLSTDGLCDRINEAGDRYGEKRLRRVLTSHSPIHGDPVLPLRDLILREVSTFAGSQPSDDDLTLVVCHYAGVGAQGVKNNVA
jgi:sigma-B regulation protein RsbU (phosphoserine phosphatase)